ncbi:bifunctional diguanylate cyclase/phosphodiesterase [Pseudonocardia sp. DSM 110487]|uniref:putative bifunctional diguanylate cyclase/phosphodiesterase n=1 Tax=Pseudonocardia sp. DSM 110487 TaxID=2865833 RepID=UPI002102C011|nr:GGDEF domain-containing phosphodiesterase [Pseudonocardia sp. DSM 110487]
MRELGHRLGDGPVVEPPTEPHGASEAVLRADLHREQRAVLGAEVHPEAALFASRLARAVAEAPDRDRVSGVAGSVPLPAEPALLHDGDGRVVRANDALAAMAGAADPRALVGARMHRLLVGAEPDAQLVRADGSRLPVRVVRWPLPGIDLTAVVIVERPEVVVDPVWAVELERLARIGTWSFDLATSALERSGTLDELYRSVGVDPDGGGCQPIEGEQVAALCEELRAGNPAADHHVELQLPGDRMLSCRAQVERGHDGTPLRLIGVVHDLSAERVARFRVERSGRRFADLMALVPGGVALLDPAGRVVDANEGMCTLLGVPLERLRGTAATALSADDASLDGATLPEWLRAVPTGARHGYRVDSAPLRRADGTTVWCELAVSATAADDGGFLWLVTCADVSDRRLAAELLRSAGTVDELTRLPNRAAGLELVDRLLAGPGRDRVAVVCGDLDDFARVNSSLGHDAGDDLLVSLAARLQRELPFGCTAARLGADEFVVICADHAEVGGPDLLARTVADLLRTTITVCGRPVQMTATVGLATPVPTGEVRAADLLRFAEAAMHDAKRRQARGGIGIATDGVVSSATKALELEAELRAAIATDGLVLDYQPVVGPDGTVVSAEALVRWPHPERGLIPPNDFLPVAQRSGLLRELDLWVLRAATREAAAWPAHRGRRSAVAVNLAGLLPGDAGFLSAVTDAVSEAGLEWDRLVLELVETSLVALPPHALAAMAELTERGVRFAVDDFGTGYSSLARLKELPAQTVKVDRAFVTGIADDPADFAVARAVVDMARAMGRTTVAEGVETAEQFHVLRGIGVDAYQGWLFSRPLRSAGVRDILARGRLATPASAGRLIQA